MRLAATVSTEEEGEEFRRFLDAQHIIERDRVIRRIALRGFAANGVALARADLMPEITITAEGVFWHPVGAEDADLLVTRDIFPLAEAFAAVRRAFERESSTAADWQLSSIARDCRGLPSGKKHGCIGKLRRRCHPLDERCRLAVEEALFCRRYPQRVVPIEVRRFPAAKPFCFEDATMAWIVVAHPGQRFGESLPQRRVKIGSSSEHAVIKRRRSPDFSQRALRHQVLSLQGLPERTANCAGISAAIEDRANDVGFTRAGITMFAKVAVEAQRTVLLSLEEAFSFQKINREDRGVTTVTTAQRQGAISKIGKPRDWPAANCDDLGFPTNVGVTHRQRMTAMVAPGVGLQIRKVRVPGYVNARRGIIGSGEQCAYLRLVTLKQYDLYREVRIFMEVASHAFPYCDHLRIVRDRTYPDRLAHNQNRGIPRIAFAINSRRTSPVGAITAPA